MTRRKEQPKPILGSQPPPLGSTLIKYMEPKYPIETGLEMVSSKPYYQEEEQQGSYSWEDFAEMRSMGNDFQYGEINPFMLLGPSPKQFSSYPQKPPRLEIKYYKCTRDL